MVIQEDIEEREFFDKVFLNQTHDYDEYQLTYTHHSEFIGQLFVYAQDIEIIFPESLKLEFINKAIAALELNHKKLADYQSQLIPLPLEVTIQFFPRNKNHSRIPTKAMTKVHANKENEND